MATMTDAARREVVKTMTLRGAVRIDPHARERMRQRGIGAADVVHGLTHATVSTVQTNGRWKLESTDSAGDDLTLVVIVEDNVVVVTVY